MAKIKEIKAREVLDSRGFPTIETWVSLSSGITTRSSVPSGISVSAYEAIELRDHDQKRFNGMGVLTAVKNVNEIIGPKLVGMDVLDQQKIDSAMIEMDGTQNKGKLGANSILSISCAVAKLGARSSSLPVFLYLRQFVKSNVGKKTPIPMFNLLEGGKHASASLNFQEFLLMPASTKTYSESLRIGVEIYQSLKQILYEKSESLLSADEGGFSPNLTTNQSGIVTLREAIERAGFSYAFDAFIGLDVAANSFLDGKVYKISDRSIAYSSADLAEFYKLLVTDYSLIYLEDPFSENDWNGWKKAALDLASKTLIVGDDLIATNPYRLQQAIESNVIGGVIIKPNQIGTITEAIAVAEVARYK
ncbi:MAG: phosphopyruvate hydratase [Candidatus Levybacteria bacterium]|nr:phosphopyruvate hydratase [Candidatus Levybacteria bacterium]